METDRMGTGRRLVLGAAVLLLVCVGPAVLGGAQAWCAQRRWRAAACAAARQRLQDALILLQTADEALAQPSTDYPRRVAALAARADARRALAAAEQAVARLCPERRLLLKHIKAHPTMAAGGGA
jgi:hypothetical protein